MTIQLSARRLAISPLRLHASFYRSFATKPALHWEVVGATKDAEKNCMNVNPTSSILFLHGLLGNGRNLKTLASKVCSQEEDSISILMDLRGHGKSVQTFPQPNPPHNFDACVQDVKRTLDIACTVSSSPFPPPTTVVGHSWGGRVALQYAASVASNESRKKLDRVWLLDTVPGQANESVEKVIDSVTLLLEDCVNESLDRKQVVERLTARYGLEIGLAQWLASSYKAKGSDGSASFGFDLDVVHGVLSDFEEQDFFGLLSACLQSDVHVDLVRGGKNSGWSVDVLRQLGIHHGKNFTVHVLPKAGHWVHVDDLPGLLKLMSRNSISGV